ncbi:hypothetical protein DOK_06372 [gamma proteobacterium BDW918]|jgi:hypothetical protein|nr:hypothetical protein DOK_06372 [gamma proteobacterium BDW918]
MKRKLTGSATASLVLFFASSMLASVLGLRQVDRMTTEPGWVAGGDIAAGAVIMPNMLKEARISDGANVMSDPRSLFGKRLKIAKKEGDTFKPEDIAPAPARKTLAQAIPEGRVLYTLIPNAGGIPHSQLTGGDRLDVLVTGRGGVRTVARDVRLIGVMDGSAKSQAAADGGPISMLKQKPKNKSGSRTGVSLVVAVYPDDVYPLASIGSNDKVSLVLHGSRDLADGQPLRVRAVPTHRSVEVVSGLSRSKVHIRL